MADTTIENLAIQVDGPGIDELLSKLDRLASSLGRFSGASKRAGTAAQSAASGAKEFGKSARQAGQQAEQATDKMQKFANSAKNPKTFFDKMKNASAPLKMLSSSLTGITRGARATGSAFASMAGWFGGILTRNIRESVRGLGRFYNSIKRIAMYRAIRSAMRFITQHIADGMRSLYSWSQTADGVFAASMDRLATASKYAGNSIAAMASPLINALAPAIDFIIDKFVDMFNIVNQIFARLTGQTSYTAAKKVAAQWGGASDSASGSAKKAAKEIRKTILGFDEINKLNDNRNGGGGGGGAGGGGTDYSSMFETRTIDGAISSFVDQIRAAFALGDWESIGRVLGEKVNEVVDSIDFAGIGKKVGYGINGWFTTKYWTLDTINFINIGSKIAEFLNSAIDQIDFNVIGRYFVRQLTIIGDLFVGFFLDFDWGNFASKLSSFVIGLADEISKWIEKHDWEEIGKTLAKKLIDVVSNIDYAGIVRSLALLLKDVFKLAVGMMSGLGEIFGNKIKDAFKGIEKYFQTQIELCGGNIWKGILVGIGKAVLDVGVWIRDNVLKPFIDAFKRIFGISSPAKKMYSIGRDILLGVYEGIKEKIKGIKAWIKTNVFDKFSDALKSAGKLVLDVYATLKTKAIDLWNNLSFKWSEIKNKVVMFSANVSDNAKEWWDQVKKGWDRHAGKIVEFSASIIKNAQGWWEQVKKSWDDYIRQIGGFLGIGVKATIEEIEAKEYDGKLQNLINNPGTTSDQYQTFIDQNPGKSSYGGEWEKNKNQSIWDIIGGRALAEESPTNSQYSEDFFKTQDFFTKITSTSTKIDAFLDNLVERMSLGLHTGNNSSITSLTKGIEDGDIIQVGVRLLKYGWSSIGDFIGQFVDVYTALKKNGWSSIASFVGTSITVLAGLKKNGWSSISSFVGTAVTILTNLGKNNWSNIKNYLTGNNSGNVAIGLTLGSVASSLKAALRKIGIKFATGGVIFASGGYQRFANGGAINAYAGGTSDAQGTLFLAGEAGPEIVGHIGGRTEVLNRSQLAATMYAAVKSAMTGVTLDANFYGVGDASAVSEENMAALLELVRSGSDATVRQNELLRQQIEYLREISEKEFTAEVSTADVSRGMNRMNRRVGATVIPVGT